MSLLILSAALPLRASGSARTASLRPLLRLSGEFPGGLFGRSLAAAGDVNGDGYGDWVVGSAALDAHGRVDIFLGGPQADSVADIALEDEFHGRRRLSFGAAVAGAGDMNGDGYADVMIGDPYAVLFTGRVHVYYGGPDMDTAADLILSGTRTTELFGRSVSPAGDLNGDGYADAIVGSPWWHAFSGGEQLGRAFLYFGGAHPEVTPRIALPKPPPPSLFGDLPDEFAVSVASAGDVNGDGHPDLIVAQKLDTSGSELIAPGRSFVFFGGPTMDTHPDLSMGTVALPLSDGNGPLVSGVGDVNGDGFADLAVRGVGPLREGGSSHDYDIVNIYFGGHKSGYLDEPDRVLHSDDISGSFGSSISGGADLTGDGYPDILVGAPLGSPGGRAYLFYGGPDADGLPDAILDGQTAGSLFGRSLAQDDVSGDGVADAIVGAPGDPTSAPFDPGHVYVYDLSIPLAARAFLRGGGRTIPLVASPAPISVEFEPVEASYENASVDFPSIRLTSVGTGEVDAIPALPSKRAAEGDADGDGVADLSVRFGYSDLQKLFSQIRGRRAVEAALEGRLLSRRKFRAPISLTLVNTGRTDPGGASVAPNPLNPGAILTFTTQVAGPVTVKLFDARGRRVRTVVEGAMHPAGIQTVRIDSRDDHGRPLASGIYFYQVEMPDGRSQGRLVVAK